MDTFPAGRLIYMGKTTFRRQGRLFGVREVDRFSHLYLIGRTGAGKSTLLGTMALQDLAAGRTEPCVVIFVIFVTSERPLFDSLAPTHSLVAARATPSTALRPAVARRPAPA